MPAAQVPTQTGRPLGSLGPGTLAFDPLPAPLVPLVGGVAGHLGGQVATVQARGVPGQGHQGLGILLRRVGGERAHLQAVVPDAGDQRPGVQAGDPRHFVAFQKAKRIGSPTRI